MTNEGKKKQFILSEDDARRLAGTCTTFSTCYYRNQQTHMRLSDLLEFIGPLSEAHENRRRAMICEYEELENSLDLAARLGERFEDMVKKIRTHWLVDDIIKLFMWLRARRADELRV
jgi:hypothetical protein